MEDKRTEREWKGEWERKIEGKGKKGKRKEEEGGENVY